MDSFNRVSRISGIAVFLITFIVFFFSAESSGSLWDCGEFILAAHKLEVVHPPGAPLFMLVGRMFTYAAEVFSDNPTNIAFMVNVMSGFFGALTALMVCWITMIFGKLILHGRGEVSELIEDDQVEVRKEDTGTENMVLAGAGVVAGLATAFSTSIWFSAVEGEVYAMSTFFTAFTFWAAVKWFYLPDNKQTDRWLVLAAYSAGLSIGVHLLSILTFPAIGLLYYFKKNRGFSILGVGLSMLLGVIAIAFVMKGVVAGIPTVWKNFELFLVNDLGAPIHSGLIPTMIIVIGLIIGLLKFAHNKGNHSLQLFTMAAAMVVIGFSTLGVVPIRANADTPINMNVPSDATRLLPYLNREQYGERPLLRGPLYDSSPTEIERSDRYGLVDGRYEIIDEKFSYKYPARDNILFPRAGHSDRAQLHNMWRTYLNGGEKARGRPGMKYNLGFLWNYQIKYMYGRYFMWNFVGRQNGEQGFYPWDESDGNWESGISAYDNWRLFDDSLQPKSMQDKAKNHYYFLPFLFGFLGLFFHAYKRPKDFSALLVLFLITGIGIIIYSNQPPNEPRERDYVLAGSIFTFCVWIGLAVVALFSIFRKYINNLPGKPAAVLASIIVLTAPLIMGFENFDDHSRRGHYATRDYASNFLNSLEKDAIIFTYGDNDTYPVWYAQEVEGIRRDVRVVNLSLIQVDWYIDKLRAKVNDSAPIKMTLSSENYRGKNNNQLFFANGGVTSGAAVERPLNIYEEFNFIASGKNVVEDRRTGDKQNYTRSKNLIIPIDRNKAVSTGWASPSDTTIVDHIPVSFKKGFMAKDELAILDLIVSNMYDRPIYFAVTCRNEKLLGLNDYMEMEGLGLRLVPTKNKGEQESLLIYGSGKMDAETAYDNIMNKWKWGNFDKQEAYINRSYAAEVQAMKMVMIRTATTFLRQGKKEKAADICKKYFSSFPHFNFPYEPTIYPFIDILMLAGEKEEAKKHMQILADEVYARLTFVDSLDEREFKSFEDEFRIGIRGANDILGGLSKLQDPAFAEKMQELLGKYDIKKIREQGGFNR